MNNMKKLLALLLAIVMVVGMVPFGAMAEETTPTTEATVPPTTEATVPPTTEATVPPTTEETVPPTTEETVPPTTEETVPPTTEETVPPTTEQTVPPTTVETVPGSVFCEICQKNDCGLNHEEDTSVKVGDKLWLKSGAKVYKQAGDQEGYAVKLPYHIVIKEVQTVEGADWYRYEFADISALAGGLLLGSYKWVPAANTAASEDIAIPEDMKEAATEASEALEDLEKIIENIQLTVQDKIGDTGVEISGIMPENIRLLLEEVSIPDQLKEMTSIEDDHIAFSFDITLAQPTEKVSFFGGSKEVMEEWQPEEGEPVTVTMDVPDCEDGNIIAVYHEDGETGEVELVGLYPVEEGKIEFEAEGFSIYTGVIVHYFANPLDGKGSRWFTAAVGQEMEITSILEDLNLTYKYYPNSQNYYFSFYNATAQDGSIFVQTEVGFRESEGKSYLNPFAADTARQGSLLQVSLTAKDNSEAINIAFLTNLSDTNNKWDMPLCLMYQKDSNDDDGDGDRNEGMFFLWDEANDRQLSSALGFTINGKVVPLQTLEEAAYYGWTTLKYQNVRILMNDTYQAGKPTEQLTEFKQWAAVSEGKSRVPYEEVKPNLSAFDGQGQHLTIERYSGFKGSLIQVNFSPSSPLDVWAGVTIDNKSQSGENLTAVTVVNNDGDGGLFIHRGAIIDSNAIADGSYRGVGVYVTSSDSSKRADADGGKADHPITRGEGGILELENGCRIAGFAIGVKQDYGTTAITYRAPGVEDYVSSAPAGTMDVADNTHSIVLYHNNRIEKWSTYANGIPGLSLYLEDIERWKNGDIVLASGYEWRRNWAASGTGSAYDGDGNGSYDHYRTPVVAADNTTGIQFENTNEFYYAMGLEYFHPYPEDDTKNQFKNPDDVQFHEPYPVIRFQTQTVYNTRSHKWYFTLGAAVAESQANDELVFYGDTQESGTVAISHNLTIRSSYPGEQPYANEHGTEPISDVRAGGNYTATWARTDNGVCIRMQGGADITFEGTDTENGLNEACGTLTLDANGTGGVLDMYGESILNIEDGITLTGGNVGQGGAIMNMTGIVNMTGGIITDNNAWYGGGIYLAGGELNLTGGTISNNNAIVEGDGIYQGGTFKLSGDPVFSGHTNEDVYLPTTVTSDSGAVYVITKAGDFGFTTPVTVTLGNSDSNLYNGRNVVESGAAYIAEADLDKFTVTNANVQKDKLTQEETLAGKFQFKYTANDATHSSHKTKPILELYQEITFGKMELTKVVEKRYLNDTIPENQEYEFTVTYTGSGAKYKIGENGTETDLASGGTIKLKNGQTAYISNVPTGAYTIVETALAVADFETPVWTLNETAQTESYTVTGDLQISGTDDTDELICTNYYKKHLGDLKITKTVTGTVPDAPAFVFHVTGSGVDMRVTIDMTGKTVNSVTIKDLPFGDYTVTEDTGWSAKYTVSDGNTRTATVSATDNGAVSFTNTRGTKWLTWDTNISNHFYVQN